MKLNRKVAAVFPALLLLGAGCSGINTSQSISPATFLLPGILKAEPPPAHPDSTLPVSEPVKEVVQS